jgi:hypothetical protein
VGTDSFLSQGTSGFHWFLRTGRRMCYFPTLENLVLDVCRSTPQIAPTIDNRWTFEGGKPTSTL